MTGGVRLQVKPGVLKATIALSLAALAAWVATDRNGARDGHPAAAA